jgi:WS/DGAT/MGAT family acyltransferase
LAKVVAGLSKGQLSRVKNIPRTRFNGSVSPHRVFDAINVPLDDVKKIKNSVPGATVNDVAITIVGGALHKYLKAHDELPEHSLAAMAPVNVRSDKDKTGGNIVASMTVQVRSDIAEPLARLEAVHESSSKAKELTNAIGAKTMTDYSQFIPATLTAQAARLASRWGLMNRMSPQFNCVITNVPGPPIPLYNTGAKMVANYGTGPVQDGLGLFHVISSYCGQFVISATSCRVMMPDPAFYRECLQASFDELLAAANATTAATPPKKKTKPRKARKAA